MDRAKKVFDIIRFTADSTFYYGASVKLPKILLDTDEYTRHTDIEIPIGQSRYGGPVADLPPGLEPPNNLRFAAQLDLAKFSPFDRTGRLPPSGQLIFFANIRTCTGKVIYADIANESLVRRINEHDDDFFSGRLVDKIYPDTETLSERFSAPAKNEMYLNPERADWQYDAGSEKSKIFGIFTHCQMSQTKIEEITFSNKILLLQVGENGFNDEGVFSVLIDKNDLENRIFDDCQFYWAQS